MSWGELQPTTVPVSVEYQQMGSGLPPNTYRGSLLILKGWAVAFVVHTARNDTGDDTMTRHPINGDGGIKENQGIIAKHSAVSYQGGFDNSHRK